MDNQLELQTKDLEEETALSLKNAFIHFWEQVESLRITAGEIKVTSCRSYSNGFN